MTSFIAWVGVDSHAPSSVYFASDSRLSTDSMQWDFGRKLFASKISPDIFGYVGDVLFPSQILSQLVDIIDSGILFLENDSVEKKLDKIRSFLKQVTKGYPNVYLEDINIYYCSRVDVGGQPSIRSTFNIYRLSWSSAQWFFEPIQLPNKSGAIVIDGTGQFVVKNSIEIWENSKHKDTSRSIFSAFCDALETGGDPDSGGAPQLVGIYRKWNAKYFGIVTKGNRYFLGLPVVISATPNNIHWFNDIFEITDGETKERRIDAQKHQDIAKTI